MRAGLPFVLLLSLGCASAGPLVASTDLAAKARANPIAAQRDLAKTQLTVRGVVTQSTLVPRRSVQVSGYPYTATATQVNETLAVVILMPGTVLCYFEPDNLADAADAKEGMTIDLSCRVDSIRVDAGQTLAVLGNCRRAAP